MSPTGTSTPPPQQQQQAQAQAQAQILTRALLPQLAAIQQLDASDVLECYTLVRLAPLHQPQFNSTIMIQKMALGFVYRPTSAKNHYSNNNFKKQPLELTLESRGAVYRCPVRRAHGTCITRGKPPSGPRASAPLISSPGSRSGGPARWGVWRARLRSYAPTGTQNLALNARAGLRPVLAVRLGGRSAGVR